MGNLVPAIKKSYEIRESNRSNSIHLSKKEYAHVIGELNTHLSKERRRKRVFHQAIGNYIYIVENHGFNSYTIRGKIKIK